MRDRRIRDLWPWSDAISNLEELLAEALKLPEFVEGNEESWMGPRANSTYERLKKFKARVRERGLYIGEVSAARILRQELQPPVIRDTANEPRLKLGPARSWVDNTIANIQFELDLIERRQALYVTALATIIAAIAAGFAFLSVIIEIAR